jgi:hypothetical protein
VVCEIESERQTYAEVLEQEVKQVLRMVRAFPADRFERRDPECGVSARDLARELASHVRRIEEIACGRRQDAGSADTDSRGGILREIEAVFLGTYMTLDAMPAARWTEVIPSPAGLAPWQHARRGELMWLALRELARHIRHLAFHLGGAGGDDEPGREARLLGPFEELAVGA